MYLSDVCLTFQELSFRFIELREVHSASFCGLKSLQILKLDYNKLHTMPELSPVKPTLQELYLSENQLARFPNDYFKGFLQLRELLVNDNHLEAAPSISWLTSTLQWLSLENNRITSIAGLYSETPFQKLITLYLENNEISNIDIRILSKMPKLNPPEPEWKSYKTYTRLPSLLGTHENKSIFKPISLWFKNGLDVHGCNE